MSFTENGTNQSYSTSQKVNGWGQVIESVNQHGGQVNISYDTIGRVSSQTNPFQSGGTPSSYTVSNSYDALGRPMTTTLQDGDTVQVSYSGHTVTTTDQVNRKLKQEMDGLGALDYCHRAECLKRVVTGNQLYV